jgi:hypothetical protein
MREIRNGIPRTNAVREKELETEHIPVPADAEREVAHVESDVVEGVPGCS